MPRILLAFLLALLLAAPASAQEAREWVEYGRSYAEARAYKVLKEEPGGTKEVLARAACLPDLKETGGCVTALELYRKLSGLVMGGMVTFRAKAPPGAEEPGPAAERLTRYAVDCARKEYAPLSLEWRDARGEKIMRADYPGREWRALDRIEELGKRVCK